MWYEDFGKTRVKELQVCFYDTEHGGGCFDEAFYNPSQIGHVVPYVETIEEENSYDRRRVFVHMNNGDVYELSMNKLTEEQFAECNNFYGGR